MRIFSLFLFALLKSYAHGQAKVCFMVYQQADTSNIEPAIIEDLVELTYSDGVTSPNMTTWVYHDGRNFDRSGQSQWDPIDNVWTADGSQLVSDQRVTKFTGSRYFTFDHALGKMVVDTTLSGEKNSDDPEVMFEFFSYAMENCLLHRGEDFLWPLPLTDLAMLDLAEMTTLVHANSALVVPTRLLLRLCNLFWITLTALRKCMT